MRQTRESDRVAHQHHARGLREVQPERGGAGRERSGVPAAAERLLEQRRPHREFLPAGDLLELVHRDQQRRRRLHRALGQRAGEAIARAGDEQPAIRLLGVGGERRRDGAPAVRLGLVTRERTEQRVERRLPDRDRRLPVGREDGRTRVQEARQTRDHRALRVRLAQPVGDVALQRAEPPEERRLVAHDRGVDVAHDVAERRVARDREHRAVRAARPRRAAARAGRRTPARCRSRAPPRPPLRSRRRAPAVRLPRSPRAARPRSAAPSRARSSARATRPRPRPPRAPLARPRPPAPRAARAPDWARRAGRRA